MNKCKDCKHWTQLTDFVLSNEFGTCAKAQQYLHRETPLDVVSKWQMCVIDGSDYFAALKTRSSFGCNEFENNDN